MFFFIICFQLSTLQVTFITFFFLSNNKLCAENSQVTPDGETTLGIKLYKTIDANKNLLLPCEMEVPPTELKYSINILVNV